MLSAAWAVARTLWVGVNELPLRAAVALGSAGLGQPPRPAQLWKAYLIVLPVGVATWWAIPRFTLVMSPSIDAWAVRAAPGPIHKGDLVSFLLDDRRAAPEPVTVTKYALCMPGERLGMIEKPNRRTRDGWYYCGGELLGVSKAYGRRGQRLDHYRPTAAVVPPGTIYVGSHHPDGFDSRYYGPIAIQRLTRMDRIL